MTVSVFGISTGADDGYADKTTGSYFNSNNDWVGLGADAVIDYQAFFRFQNVEIPQGAVIVSAKVRFYSTLVVPTECPVKIHLENADNPAVPTTGAQVIARSMTTGVSWTIPSWTTAYYYSEDFASEVQTVVNRGGWNSGNALIVNIIDNGAGIAKSVESYDETGTERHAQLEIEWYPAGAWAVSASGDDGGAKQADGSSFQNGGISAYLGKVFADAYRAFFRFQNINIPAEATIESAYLTIRSYSARSGTVSLIIHCEDADDTTAPTDGTDLLSRPLTTGTAWSESTSWSFGSYYDTEDFAADLQEVLNRPGWASGNAVTIHILDNGGSYNVQRFAGNYDLGGYAAVLNVTYSVPLFGIITESFSLNDSIDAEFGNAVEVLNSFSVDDVIDALLETPKITDSFGVNDSIDAQFEGIPELSESIGLSDFIEGYFEAEIDLDDSFSLDDTIDALNFSSWLRVNLSKAIQRFFLVLTGAADGVDDVQIPIESAYAYRRSGDPTYMQVVVPDVSYAAAIAARSNGELRLDTGYEVAGVVALRETLLSVDLEEIQLPEGAVNRSIVLSGHKTESYVNQTVSFNIGQINYRNVATLTRTYRFTYIDFYANPGDTFIIGSDSFVAESISYIIGPTQAIMEAYGA